MRRFVCTMVSVAALALAGCNGSGSTSQDAQEGASSTQAAGNKVTGTVSVRGGGQPSSAAKLVVNLVDVSAQGAAPLASKTIEPATQFPVSFELDFNPAEVKADDLYVIKADLTDGDRHYSMPLQAPVLTKGASNQVSIQLVAEQTPAEKELADFQGLQKQIGGMKISNGSKLEKDVSRAWQVFRANNEVRFIREQADYGNKGFTSTDYAYKDGKPWVVVQQKKASQSAKPSSTVRAGWDDNGQLLLKQSEADGKTDVLGDDAAAALKQQAQTLYGLAGGKAK
ncbi:YbaY family lipoprotein [Frateuria defendens]|uniref:YbaY family lipoprotein n=1 Tax=Frateuria defendens TaxID=2219559 RepID=UPI00066FC796|nr:YbaY family lipoprotein [Frateuria defendens]